MTGRHGSTSKAVWQRDKGKCHLCTCPVALKDASRDHIETASSGGYDAAANYHISHTRCNHARGNLPLDLAYEVVRELHGAGVRLTPHIVQEALYVRLREYRRFMRSGQRTSRGLTRR